MEGRLKLVLPMPIPHQAAYNLPVNTIKTVAFIFSCAFFLFTCKTIAKTTCWLFIPAREQRPLWAVLQTPSLKMLVKRTKMQAHFLHSSCLAVTHTNSAAGMFLPSQRAESFQRSLWFCEHQSPWPNKEANLDDPVIKFIQTV